mmetsp:Transcript_129713/g.361276  ORF Transcript_129713/g.361276 Transcript_129713/m.361276 type:complete len:284 (+) Transcript_129713:315-1166(+)
MDGNARSKSSGLQETSRNRGGKLASAVNSCLGFCGALTPSSGSLAFALASMQSCARPRHRHRPTRDGISSCTRSKSGNKRPRGSCSASPSSTPSMRACSMSMRAAASRSFPMAVWHMAKKKHLQLSTMVVYIMSAVEMTSLVSGSPRSALRSSFNRSQKRIPSSGRQTFRASDEPISSSPSIFARWFESRTKFRSTLMLMESSRAKASSMFHSATCTASEPALIMSVWMSRSTSPNSAEISPYFSMTVAFSSLGSTLTVLASCRHLVNLPLILSEGIARPWPR